MQFSLVKGVQPILRTTTRKGSMKGSKNSSKKWQKPLHKQKNFKKSSGLLFCGKTGHKEKDYQFWKGEKGNGHNDGNGG